MDKQNQQLVGCFSTNFSSLKQLPTVFFPKAFPSSFAVSVYYVKKSENVR